MANQTVDAGRLERLASGRRTNAGELERIQMANRERDRAPRP